MPNIGYTQTCKERNTFMKNVMKSISNKNCTILGCLPEENESHSHSVAIKERLRTEILDLTKQGYTTFFSGVELGIEMWGAEIVLELQKTHPTLKLIPYLADERRADDWEEPLRERYFDHILPQSEPAIYTEFRPDHDSMMKRDKLMIQRSAVVLAFFKGEPLEMRVAHSLNYAKEQNCKTIFVDISTL